jgi:hypothetical protein
MGISKLVVVRVGREAAVDATQAFLPAAMVFVVPLFGVLPLVPRL